MAEWTSEVTSELTSAPASDDFLLVRDKSDTTDGSSGTDKKQKVSNFYTNPSITGSIKDTNGNNIIGLNPVSNPANNVEISNAASGNTPTLSAVGGDSNIKLRFEYKGSGSFDFVSPDDLSPAFKAINSNSNTVIRFGGTSDKAFIDSFGTSPLVLRTTKNVEAARYTPNQEWLLGKTTHAADLAEVAGTIRSENGQNTILYRGVDTNTSDEIRFRTDGSDRFVGQVYESSATTTRDIWRIDPTQAAQMDLLGSFSVASNTNLKGSVDFSNTTSQTASGTNGSYKTSGDSAIFVDTATNSTAFTVTLASADVVKGRKIWIKDSGGGAGTNSITIDTEGSETIDGDTSATIDANNESIEVVSDGTNWFVVGRLQGGGVI